MFGLNFRQLPVANGTAFSKISKKEDNLTRYTQIFESFFPEIFFPFNFAPGNSRIFCYMVRISEIQHFSGFSGNFSGKLLHHLPLFPNFRKFWLNGPKFLIGLGFKVRFVTIFRFLVPRYVLTTFVAFECNLFRRSSLKPMFTLTTLQAFVFVLAKLVKK